MTGLGAYTVEVTIFDPEGGEIGSIKLEGGRPDREAVIRRGGFVEELGVGWVAEFFEALANDIGTTGRPARLDA